MSAISTDPPSPSEFLHFPGPGFTSGVCSFFAGELLQIRQMSPLILSIDKKSGVPLARHAAWFS